MALTDLLLTLDTDYTLRLGLPPRDRLDNYNNRSIIYGKLKNVSLIACSPDVELFCVRAGDLYRGPIPSNKDVDWFSVARRVGRSDWNRYKFIFFHPNRDLYCVTFDGRLYKGPPPDNEYVPWIYDRAQKIGTKNWDQYEAMYFDPEGYLYAVGSDDKFYKGLPPTDETSQWRSSSLLLGIGDWLRLTYFMAVSPDKKLWCVDKWNGNLYKGVSPELTRGVYLINADYLGWNYNKFRFLAFTKDRTIHNIISFEFLPEEGKKVSECPEVLEEKVYDNRRSSSPLNHTFTFSKTLKESSEFSHEHGFTFEMGIETNFKTGVPVIAEGTVSVKMNMSTTHNWNFTKANENEITFASSTNVDLEAGKAIRMVASVVKAEINVPYKARARTMFGSEVEIRGTWHGVSHYNLMVAQEDYNK